jgi:hypothetical protein
MQQGLGCATILPFSALFRLNSALLVRAPASTCHVNLLVSGHERAYIHGQGIPCACVRAYLCGRAHLWAHTGQSEWPPPSLGAACQGPAVILHQAGENPSFVF